MKELELVNSTYVLSEKIGMKIIEVLLMKCKRGGYDTVYGKKTAAGIGRICIETVNEICDYITNERSKL